MTSQMTSHVTMFARAGNPMDSWQVQDAKARFSELLDVTLKKGPQFVTRRGIKAAVLVPIEEWERLQQVARPSLKQWLLASTARTDNVVPERGKTKSRRIGKFE